MILSHPFRVTPAGIVATVDEGSTRANAEAVAIVAGTVLGERDLEPMFGITDPVFATVNGAEVQTALDTFGPPGITVDEVVTEPVDDSVARVLLTFTEEGAQE